jgi:hypothetical protein
MESTKRMLGLNRKNNDNNNNSSSESIIKWFEEGVEDGENSILVYPNLQTFRQIYTKYGQVELAKAGDDKDNNDNSGHNKKSKSRIILIAPYYETADSVKHHLSAFGAAENIHRLIDDGSLVIVDSFHSFFPDPNGMKKLIDSLSQRARKEGRAGVTAVVDMGSFFLFGGDGKATELISYESSLAPKTQDGNVRGFSCYHLGNYQTLTEADKEQITQGQKKKLLEVTESDASDDM